MTRFKRSPLVVATFSAVCLVVGLVVFASTFNDDNEVSEKAPVLKIVTAQQMLAMLEVKEEDPRQDYDREAQFGDWITEEGAHCNTKQRVLARDSQVAISRDQNCDSAVGQWVSPYDGKFFVRSDNGQMEIDHMVSEKEAWVSGAADWTHSTRRSFSNDLGYDHSLVAVSMHANKSKGDREPGEWQQGPIPEYECTFVGYWIAVKYRWDLSVDSKEKDHLEQEVERCGNKSNVEVPKKVNVVRVDDIGDSTIATPIASSTSERFANCADVRAHGQGPYIKGRDFEYDWYRDGDGDGTVCE